MSSKIALAVCTELPSTQLHLCEYLHDRIAEQPLAESWWLLLVEDSSLSIENALQLQTCERILFVQIDAQAGEPPGYSFAALNVERGHKILPTAGDLSPADLMHALATMRRSGASPSGFLLRVSAPPQDSPGATNGGIQRAESDPTVIDQSVRATLDTAAEFLAELLENSELDYWLSRASVSQPAPAMACEN